MGRRGPKPQPTALKVERGNPGKRALPVDEPKLSGFPREVPKGMTGLAREEWLRLVDELADKGVLTIGDLRPFARYCRLVAAEAAAEALIEKTGLEQSLAEKHDRYLDRVQSQLMKQEARLGLDPSSRSAIKAVKPASEKDEKRARFFGKGA
jgi:P27 family predicted phage terminase small subunit